MVTGTDVFLSSGHTTLTSTSSPTDFPLIFKNKYSISKVGSVSTFTPLVRIHALITFLIAVVISLVFSLSNAKTKSFSSLTKKGLYLIDFPVEGRVSS